MQHENKKFFPRFRTKATFDVAIVLVSTGEYVFEDTYPTRSQSYDFWIYNYNASVVGSTLELFLKYKKLFFISKRTKLLMAV
jgi:hypothetical protein